MKHHGSHHLASKAYAGRYGARQLHDAAKRTNQFDGGISEAQRIAGRLMEERPQPTQRPSPTIRRFSWEEP